MIHWLHLMYVQTITKKRHVKQRPASNDNLCVTTLKVRPSRCRYKQVSLYVFCWNASDSKFGSLYLHRAVTICTFVRIHQTCGSSLRIFIRLWELTTALNLWQLPKWDEYLCGKVAIVTLTVFLYTHAFLFISSVEMSRCTIKKSKSTKILIGILLFTLYTTYLPFEPNLSNWVNAEISDKLAKVLHNLK